MFTIMFRIFGIILLIMLSVHLFLTNANAKSDDWQLIGKSIDDRTFLFYEKGTTKAHSSDKGWTLLYGSFRWIIDGKPEDSIITTTKESCEAGTGRGAELDAEFKIKQIFDFSLNQDAIMFQAIRVVCGLGLNSETEPTVKPPISSRGLQT